MSEEAMEWLALCVVALVVLPAACAFGCAIARHIYAEWFR